MCPPSLARAYQTTRKYLIEAHDQSLIICVLVIDSLALFIFVSILDAGTSDRRRGRICTGQLSLTSLYFIFVFKHI